MKSSNLISSESSISFEFAKTVSNVSSLIDFALTQKSYLLFSLSAIDELLEDLFLISRDLDKCNSFFSSKYHSMPSILIFLWIYMTELWSLNLRYFSVNASCFSFRSNIGVAFNVAISLFILSISDEIFISRSVLDFSISRMTSLLLISSSCNFLSESVQFSTGALSHLDPDSRIEDSVKFPPLTLSNLIFSNSYSVN